MRGPVSRTAATKLPRACRKKLHLAGTQPTPGGFAVPARAALALPGGSSSSRIKREVQMARRGR